jgi:hypothetical protein
MPEVKLTPAEAAAELRAIVRRLEALREDYPSVGIGNLRFQAERLERSEHA